MNQSDTLWLAVTVFYWALVFPWLRAALFSLSFRGYLTSGALLLMAFYGLLIGALLIILDATNALVFTIMVIASLVSLVFKIR